MKKIGVASLLQEAIAHHQRGGTSAAKALYHQALRNDPENPEALHMLGLLHYQSAQGREGIALVKQSMAAYMKRSNSRFATAAIYGNLGELLRNVNQLCEAESYLLRGLELYPSDTSILFNLALVREDQGRRSEQLALLQQVVRTAPQHMQAWMRLIEHSTEDGNILRAQSIFQEALTHLLDPQVQCEVKVSYGIALYRLGRIDQAYTIFANAARQCPEDSQIQINVAAMLQVAGHFDEALALYDKLLEQDSTQVQMLNNKAAILLNSGREDAAALVLDRALQLDPTCVHCLVNLATYYYEEGDLEQTFQLFDRAYQLNPENIGLLMRKALAIPAVLSLNDSIASIRQNVEIGLRQLIQNLPLGAGDTLEPIQAIERVHFYLAYHGWVEHDRVIQELVVQMYLRAWPRLDSVSAHCQAELGTLQGRQARIGFLSRFFGEKEPHGLLLSGVIRHLPRSRFEVHALALPATGRPVAVDIVDGADFVHNLSLNYLTAKQQIEALQLDVLVFGEMNSEPLNHFLGLTRMAHVQLLFWGNPITSGSPAIDYFISADIMEHPRRTLLNSSNEDPYTEQVVLLEGQGIWYQRPPLPRTWRPRAAYNLSTDWTIYLCAQSLFKIHPMMDAVFATILRNDLQKGHLVLLEGRRRRWTSDLRARFVAAGVAMDRVHFLPRTAAGDEYLHVLNIADVVLHPFPFGGSRTSAETLLLGKPLVVLRNLHLRGRMALSLYRTMGLTELIADDPAAYAQTAVSLGRDSQRRAQLGAAILHEGDRIWQRLDVVYEWARFLARVVGQQPVSPLEVGYASMEEYHADSAYAAKTWGDDLPGQLNEYGGAISSGNPPRTKPARLHQQKLRASRAVSDNQTASERALDQSMAVSDNNSISEGALDQQIVFDRLVEFGHRLHQLGQREAAVATWQEALILQPNAAYVLNDIGATLQEGGQLSAAEVYLRRAIKSLEQHDGTQPDAFGRFANNLAVTLNSIGQLEEAATWYAASIGERDQPGQDLYVNNLANLLRDAGRLGEAIEVLRRHLKLPVLHQGGALLAFVSLLDLQPRHQRALFSLEQQARAEGRWSLPEHESIMSTIGRLSYSNHLSTLNSLVLFADRLGHLGFEPEHIIQELSGMEAPSHIPASARKQLSQTDHGGLHFLVGYYKPPSRVRQREIDLCLLLNAFNPYITHIHLLRLTFRTAFEYAHQHLPGQLCILANADIFFDSTLARLWPSTKYNVSGTLLALLRWEVRSYSHAALQGEIERQTAFMAEEVRSANEENFWNIHTGTLHRLYQSKIHPRIDSQDAWIFRASALQGKRDLQATDFEMGRPRSDNRLAALLQSSYRLISPSFAIRAHHLHFAHDESAHQAGNSQEEEAERRERKPFGYTGLGQVTGEMAFVRLSDQWRF